MNARALRHLVAFLAATAVTSAVWSAPVSWTDWESATVGSVAGSLDADGTAVDVVFSGPYSFAQTAGGGTNYWIPSAPYVGAAVDNAPPGTDIIALSAGGTKTITFSQAVQDPLIALVSWNGNTVDFGVPIEILSFGAGFWGNGTPILNAAGTGFFGQGEVHGVIRLPGVHTQITFNDTSENWHGLTVGVTSVDGNGTIPEPGTVVLLGLGLAALGAVARRNRR